MKTRAAVLYEIGADWSVEEVDVAGPQPGEVLVRFVASGVCHSDDHIRTGDIPVAELPIIGGHEGAGIVEEVGATVTLVAPGDHVVASFLPSCGHCRWCSTGHQNLCDLGAMIMTGKMLDGTTRFASRGRGIGAMAMLGTFAGHAVVSERSLVKIPDDVALDRACLVGCGVTTGWGSAVRTGNVQPGDTVVVVGCGGVGAGAIQGARIVGAVNIVAVDVVDDKKDKLFTLGATHFATTFEEAHAVVAELTNGVMAEVAILTVGVARGDMIAKLLSLVTKTGTGVLTAMGRLNDSSVSLPMMECALWQKSLKGSLFGEANARADIPRLLDLNRKGLLQLDDFVSQVYPLDDINTAFGDLVAGKNIRGIIKHEH